jgi:hypothetical protein
MPTMLALACTRRIAVAALPAAAGALACTEH